MLRTFVLTAASVSLGIQSSRSSATSSARRIAFGCWGLDFGGLQRVRWLAGAVDTRGSAQLVVAVWLRPGGARDWRDRAFEEAKKAGHVQTGALSPEPDMAMRNCEVERCNRTCLLGLGRVANDVDKIHCRPGGSLKPSL
jgi:hypothetical protein